MERGTGTPVEGLDLRLELASTGTGPDNFLDPTIF